MLIYKNDNDKNYEERYSQAIMQIPLYSTEWTNFNPSDPGVTVLENLSLFETLQQEHINEMPTEVKAALLKMMGFVPKKGRSSRVLLMPKNAVQPFIVPKGQRFYLGKLCFEATRDIKVGTGVINSIYAAHNTANPTKEAPDNTDVSIVEMNYLLDSEVRLSVKPFTDTPSLNDELYFLCDSLPAEGEDAILYLEIDEKEKRNPLDEMNKDMFANLQWQIYMDGRFVDVAYTDHTNGLMNSGEVVMHMPTGHKPEIFEADSYCIRAVLTKAEYDIAPVLIGVYGFLFEVWQQDTRSFTQTGNRATSVDVRKELVDNHYISIFVREEKGRAYRQYTQYHGEDVAGRYYDMDESDPDRVFYRFKKSTYGYGPEKGKKAIRVIGYSEEVMRQYKLGKVEGYDDQRIKLPLQNIVAEKFFIIAKRLDEDGEGIYEFVRPGHSAEGELFYHLHERTGEIQIVDAGDFIGAELFMGGCAVYSGELGNVRTGNQFKTEGKLKRLTFTNPCPGTGGQYPEDINAVRKKFINDLDSPASAVTAQDYEKLVLTTPGLCIHKAKAYMDPARNEVRVAVLPGVLGKNGLPELKMGYQKIIEDRLEERRLLSTKVTVVKPVYAPVNVSATIMVNKSYEHTEERLNKLVAHMVNYMETDKNFGELLKFEDVFHAIENDPGVVYIQQLTLRPAKNQLVIRQEQNILPNPDAIIIPGNINLQLLTYHK